MVYIGIEPYEHKYPILDSYAVFRWQSGVPFMGMREVQPLPGKFEMQSSRAFVVEKAGDTVIDHSRRRLT